LLVKEWHVAPFFLHSAKILVVSAEFVKSAGAIFHPVWEQQEGSGCFLVIQGRWGCMLIYFEHVLIVIYRLADGESSELCGESHLFWNQLFSLLGGLSRILEALG
jgi:hypothetical protein